MTGGKNAGAVVVIFNPAYGAKGNRETACKTIRAEDEVSYAVSTEVHAR
jgi:hypothetical protein